MIIFIRQNERNTQKREKYNNDRNNLHSEAMQNIRKINSYIYEMQNILAIIKR